MKMKGQNIKSTLSRNILNRLHSEPHRENEQEIMCYVSEKVRHVLCETRAICEVDTTLIEAKRTVPSKAPLSAMNLFAGRLKKVTAVTYVSMIENSD